MPRPMRNGKKPARTATEEYEASGTYTGETEHGGRVWHSPRGLRPVDWEEDGVPTGRANEVSGDNRPFIRSLASIHGPSWSTNRWRRSACSSERARPEPTGRPVRSPGTAASPGDVSR